MKVLKTNKDLIFHKDGIPKTIQLSQLHVVALQMLGAGIMKLVVTDKTTVGTNKVISADIAMKVCVKDVERNGRFYATPCYMIDKCWTGINVHDFN